MKRWIIGLLLVGLLVGGGFYYVSNSDLLKMEFVQVQGKTAKAERKTLSIPIRATGLIEPARPPVEIKSKASGEVAEIYVKEGDLVRQGQLLLELDPVDEQRNLDRVKAQMDRSKAQWEKAKVALSQMQEDWPAGVAAAKASVAKAESLYEQVSATFDDLKKIDARGGSTTEEMRNKKLLLNQMNADVDYARAQLTKAQNAEFQIDAARQDVAMLKADYDAAIKSLEDAEERLAETKRYAPIDGMVTNINVRVGEMIQSGTTSLTGGTVLMTLADISDLYVTAQVDEADISTVLNLAPVRARPGVQRAEATILNAAITASAAHSDLPQLDVVQLAAASTQPAPDALEQGEPVKITVEAFREEEFQGMIEHISPQPLRQQSIVTYDVRIRLISPNRYKLLLGMQADVEFTLETVDAIVIPIDAVRILEGDVQDAVGGERGVWIPAHEQGSPVPGKKWRKCRFGLDDGAEIEVISGLKEGEDVFTREPIDINRDR